MMLRIRRCTELDVGFSLWGFNHDSLYVYCNKLPGWKRGNHHYIDHSSSPNKLFVFVSSYRYGAIALFSAHHQRIWADVV